MKNDFLKCVRFQQNDGKRVKEKVSLYTPFSKGNLSRDKFPILDVASEYLRFSFKLKVFPLW